MTLAFNLALHALLIGSIFIFIVGLVWASVTETDPRERLLRIAALVAGAMVTLGAQAAGMSFATFAVESLAGARPASAAANVVATIVPALLGAGMGFYTVRVFRRSERMAMRVLGFVGMLTAVAFLQVYAEATQVNGVFLGAASVPNVAFVTGIILTVVLTYDPDSKDTSASATSGLMNMVTSRFRSNEGGSTGAVAPRSRRPDPFAD